MLITQWFTPPPCKTVRPEMDLRPGGSSDVVMQDPQGNEIPNRGLFLEVVKSEKLVFTDADTKAWEPSDKPLMSAVITFEDIGGVRIGRMFGMQLVPPGESCLMNRRTTPSMQCVVSPPSGR